MKKIIFPLFLCLFVQINSNAQVKIGGEIGIINNASILELESTNKAFVLTRVTTAQMNAITPLHGALVYNLDASCVFYYNSISWVSLCNNSVATNFSFTDNGDGSYTYSDATTSFSFSSQNETITTLLDNGDGSFTYTNENGDTTDFTTSPSSFSGSFTDLTNVPTNLDLDSTDDFSGDFTDLTNVPANLDTDSTDDFSGDFADLANIPTNLDLDSTDDFSGSFADLTNVPANLDLDSTDDFSGDFGDLANIPTNLDLDSTDDFSGSFADLANVPTNLDLDSTDDFSGSFADLTNVPANLDTDSTDDFSGDFTDLTNIPANLDTDSTDDFSGNFTDLTNVPTNLDLDSTDDFSGDFADLTNIPANLDLDSTDDFSGNFTDLTNVPANLDTDSTDDFSGSYTDLTNVPTNVGVSGTEGSVFFAANDGTATENNAQLFWNNTNNQLGVGTASTNSNLHVEGSMAMAIVRTTANLTLTGAHHTVILTGNHTITLPNANGAKGRMYVIKNPTNADVSISSYLDVVGTGKTVIDNGSIVWLQSDGLAWQLVNNISDAGNSGGSSGGGGSSGVPTGVQVTSMSINDFQETNSNFRISYGDYTGASYAYEVLIENSVYDTIDNLSLSIEGSGTSVSFTHVVSDNGDGTFNHLFTINTPLVQFATYILVGDGVSPSGNRNAQCGCVTYYQL